MYKCVVLETWVGKIYDCKNVQMYFCSFVAIKKQRERERERRVGLCWKIENSSGRGGEEEGFEKLKFSDNKSCLMPR